MTPEQIIDKINNSDESYYRYHKLRIFETIDFIKKFNFIHSGYAVLNVGGWTESLFSELFEASFPDVKFLSTSHDLHDTFPYEDNSFDFILCLEVFEHIGDRNFMSSSTNFSGVFHLVYEIVRCLKHNKIFLITTPNVSSFSNIRLALLGTTPFMYPLHYREYTRHEIESILNFFKLNIIHCETHDVFLSDKRLNNRIKEFMAEIGFKLDDRGDDWFIACAKPDGWSVVLPAQPALIVYPEKKREKLTTPTIW